MKNYLLFAWAISLTSCHLLDAECGDTCDTGSVMQVSNINLANGQNSGYHTLIYTSDYTSEGIVPINLSDYDSIYSINSTAPVRFCFSETGNSVQVEQDTNPPHDDIKIYPTVILCRLESNTR